ncbi:DUF72 domain-containing protein [Bdellovibrio bacteriovorus]|uniref:DUF72 domain-containing protein n=1 Tax=Bdellovibrio bacteriovorus TaxID=959 RepID=UPI0021CFE2D7|nr:DUF72 domain-containing protein [Bdellovibrio bacteriovorus]UXR65309.1 DUF72 domain-containing protein [Bdellovibrio bacteriovorus]
MEIRIGTSGWVYPPWRKTFYPEDLPQKKELFHASRCLTSIEINGSFYSYQKPSTYQHWYNETPANFIFSVKGPQYITHINRLKDVEEPLFNFLASGVLLLKEKLGCILWQLPPSFVFNEDKLPRLETFFSLLPKTVSEAASLAKNSRRFTPTYPNDIIHSAQPLRHALEVRHHSFENPAFIDLLRKYQVALVFADTAGKWPYMEDITSDFIYLRLHGDETFYDNGYDRNALKFWAQRLQDWSHHKIPSHAQNLTDPKEVPDLKTAFIYFDNDLKIKAPLDAQQLQKLTL